jgi:DNA-directed RNA polymerase subunit RPC12/RpoP
MTTTRVIAVECLKCGYKMNPTTYGDPEGKDAVLCPYCYIDLERKERKH